MKKYIALITALAVLLSLGTAALAEEPLFYSVGVVLQTDVPYGAPKAQTLTFELRDADTGEVLGAKSVTYSQTYEAAPLLEFAVPGYSAGKRFVFALTGGEAELFYNGAAGSSFELETYSYPNEEATALLYHTEFYLTLRPAAERFINVTFDGRVRTDVALYPCPEGVLIPAGALESEVGVSASYGEDGGVTLAAGDRTLLFYPGRDTAYKNGEPMSVAPVPMSLDGELYVPAAAVAGVFDCAIRYSDDGRTLDFALNRSPYAMNEAEKRINSRGVSSDTEYLIWISKSEYTVRVFTGSKDHWHMIDSFPCAIGAPGSPTIEGTFKYYQKQDRWTYPNYYCGPIMRFYGNGYAIHSVLLRYNGGYYDGRVGMRISHGCVRLLPENINWLAATIPLQTTVYVTA